MSLEKTLRWFGPDDPVTLKEIRQTGATGVVTALHHIPNGEVWSAREISKRKKLIEIEGLSWHVVESLPVHNEIKAGSETRESLIVNYKASMENLAKAGIDIICYNFMPVLDWVRTDLEYVLPNGGITMYYDHIAFAAFDIHILKRPDAAHDYPPDVARLASEKFSIMSFAESEKLAKTIIIETQAFIDGFDDYNNYNYKNRFLDYITEYKELGKKELRNNLSYFLKQILPLAEDLKIKMAIHADDPAFPVLGLPRIVSTEDDLDWIFNKYPSPSNGLTLCTGSFSSNRDNNISDIIQKFSDKIHFLHLRNTKYLGKYSFYESGHLDGDVNMAKVLEMILKQNRSIPMRPDHGIKILDDNNRKANPGYPLLGRMKGLAELSGLEQGIVSKTP